MPDVTPAAQDTNTYKIVYCSENCLGNSAESAEEIRGILTFARANNSRHGVTGALLFNNGCFAQVLEGEQVAVQQIYERIACDQRHRKITMLKAGYAGPRDFAAWSMAYAGEVASDTLPLLVSTLNAAFSGAASNGEAVLKLLRDVVLREAVAV